MLSLVLCAAAIACGGSGRDPSPPPTPATRPVVIAVVDVAQPWIATAPAALGLDEARLTRATGAAASMPRLRSLLIARHGKLAAERYFGGADATTRFDVRSVTKSVVSLLVGAALASGRLSSLDATVGDHLAAGYSLDAGDRAVTVRQLLTMTSRYQWNETTGDDYNRWVLSSDHVQFLLDRPQTDPPDTFVYDSAAVSLLGVVLQDALGQPLPRYADETLFRPLGITTAEWETLEPGMVNGGSGMSMSAQDLLRFGQLVLQGGRSGATQVVPAAWIEAATTPRFSWRDTYGAQTNTTYGYLWWLAVPPATPASFAWGFGGQFVYVVPSLDLVVVATTQWQGIGANAVGLASQILTLVVTEILPAALG